MQDPVQLYDPEIKSEESYSIQMEEMAEQLMFRL
jgi:hypothetical protein